MPERSVGATGVEHVVNPGPAGWADTSGWRIREERAIAIADTGACGFGRVSAATLGPDGTLVVAGREPLSVAVFEATGACRGRIGRSGGGPGEFRYAMLGVSAGTVLVQDPSQARLTRLALDGTVAGIMPSACCMMGPVLPVLGDGVAAVPTVDGPREGWILFADRGPVDTLWAPEPPPDLDRWNWNITVPDGPGGEGREVSVGIPYSPAQHATILASRMVASGVSDRYHLTLADARGVVRVIEATVPRVPIADSLRDRAFEDAKGGMGVVAFAAPMAAAVREGDIPTTWPAWSTLRGDAAGRIWVGLPTTDRELGLLHVIDSTGVLLGAVPVPHPEILGSRATWLRDRVLLPDTDADGFPVVRVFVIDTTAVAESSRAAVANP